MRNRVKTVRAGKDTAGDCAEYNTGHDIVDAMEAAGITYSLRRFFSSLKLRTEPVLLAGPSVRPVYAYADWAQCMEHAQQSVIPESVRVGDFEHMWLNIKNRQSVLSVE